MPAAGAASTRPRGQGAAGSCPAGGHLGHLAGQHGQRAEQLDIEHVARRRRGGFPADGADLAVFGDAGRPRPAPRRLEVTPGPPRARARGRRAVPVVGEAVLVALGRWQAAPGSDSRATGLLGPGQRGRRHHSIVAQAVTWLGRRSAAGQAGVAARSAGRGPAWGQRVPDRAAQGPGDRRRESVADLAARRRSPAGEHPRIRESPADGPPSAPSAGAGGPAGKPGRCLVGDAKPVHPSFRHASRARVGPRSGPPCFLLPPTSVGPMPLAPSAQAAARVSPWRPSDRPAAALRGVGVPLTAPPAEPLRPRLLSSRPARIAAAAETPRARLPAPRPTRCGSRARAAAPGPGAGSRNRRGPARGSFSSSTARGRASVISRRAWGKQVAPVVPGRAACPRR